MTREPADPFTVTLPPHGTYQVVESRLELTPEQELLKTALLAQLAAIDAAWLPRLELAHRVLGEAGSPEFRRQRYNAFISQSRTWERNRKPLTDQLADLYAYARPVMVIAAK
ncbi:MAG: hypothetical protein KJ728_00910 [Alphaproteobacteria bacterium]|nr:hypothetical protein [Alphaproteobacteria bacterium]MBU1519966.1 hypothetical protein [Alphaproteobacteria bacterium]MBU2348224.1 hypothetical protein [Alphaproteobacteria bacterium]